MNRKLLGALAVAALLITACGGGNSGGGQLKSDTAAAGHNDVNAQPSDKIKQGGILQWPEDALSDNWNPQQADGNTNGTGDMDNAMLPWLFVAQADNTLTLNKDYLVSADLVSTSPQVVEYKINPKAKWSNGRAISYEDFQAQWQALNGSNKAYLTAGPVGYDQVTKVERGSDDQDVKVTLSSSFGEWKSMFSPLYPKEMNSDPTEFNKGWVDQPKITAAAFTIGKIDLTAKTVQVVKDPKWWGTPAHLDAILFKVVSRATLPDTVASGAIDVADTNGALDAVTRYKSMQGVTLRQAVAPDNAHLLLNGGQGRILSDQKLRQALFLAVDRQAIANAEIGKITPNPPLLNNHFFAQGSKQYQDNSGGLKFDLDQAKKDLDALGWKQSGQYRVKDGKELDIEYVSSNVVAANDIGKLLQQQLAAAGIKVNITAVPTEDFFKKYINVGSFDITYFRWLATSFPLSGQSSAYTVNPQDPTFVGQNYGHVGNQQINDLIQQANGELDDTKRTDLTQQADKAIWAAAGELPLYQLPGAVATKNTVANYGAMGFATNPIDYAKIGFVK